jgi:hypothetical protein
VNAETFNALYEVGIPVFAYPGARPEDFPNDRRLVTRTRSKATVLGGHTDVVWVDDHSACIALSHVDVVTEDEWKAAQTAEAVADRGALPMPAGPARLSDDLLADYAAVSFAELMEPEAAAVVTSVCDPLVAGIKRLREELDSAREHIAFQERSTLPDLHRNIEHHKAGKQRWRERAENAEAERDALQTRLHNAAMVKVWTNEDGKEFVFVTDIAPALLGLEPEGGGQR